MDIFKPEHRRYLSMTTGFIGDEAQWSDQVLAAAAWTWPDQMVRLGIIDNYNKERYRREIMGYTDLDFSDKFYTTLRSITMDDQEKLSLFVNRSGFTDPLKKAADMIGMGNAIKGMLIERGMLKNSKGAAAAGALAAAATAAATGGLVGGGRMTMNRLLLALAVGLLVYFLFKPKRSIRGVPKAIPDRDRRSCA